MNATLSPCQDPALDHLRASFLAILPRIETHAQIAFRHVACPDRRAECIAEAVALAWHWFARLARRGTDATGFVSALATFATRAVAGGRRLCGQESARDVFSPVAQRRFGFAVKPLPDASALQYNPWDEALAENTRTEVPDQVAFRIDFPEWRRTLGQRDRRLVDLLMTGERTDRAARRFGLTAGRVSQKRREFREDWGRFVGEPAGQAV
jgi:hypothetical protein